LVAEVLEQLYPHAHKGPERFIGIESIKQVTAEAYGVSVSDLESKSRTQKVLWPRQVAMYLAREEARLGLPQIGKAFQGRNHSTVINACKRVEERLSAEPTEALTVRSLARKIRGSDRGA
jgi:chromosomal replication initiator protein